MEQEHHRASQLRAHASPFAGISLTTISPTFGGCILEGAVQLAHTTCRTIAEKELRSKEGRSHSRKPKPLGVPSEELRDPQQCDSFSLTCGDSPWGLLSLTMAGPGSAPQSEVSAQAPNPTPGFQNLLDQSSREDNEAKPVALGLTEI